MYETESEINLSNLVQLDGNISSVSDMNNMNIKPDKIMAALSLPTVATYNCRSMVPKIGNLKTDILERKIDCAFLTEIWEQEDNRNHQYEIEKMLELSGLAYISAARPPNAKGISYGGAAIVVNLQKISLEKLNVNVPKNLEAVWGIIKPLTVSAKFKKIIVCSFYSPPNKKRNSKMADHLVGTLQMLSAQYPEAGLILGADRNDMDIKPILNCGLRLKQVVDQNTRKDRILDILIMNTFGYYNSPVIAPPLQPDDPLKAKPSDHWVPVCTPHTDRYQPAQRNYRVIKYRPLPESSLRKFGAWIVTENWDCLNSEMAPTEQSVMFEQLVNNKLNQFCPEKEIKLSSQDKAFITAELEKIKRQKGREYIKRGKTEKYKRLDKLFGTKYNIEAKK